MRIYSVSEPNDIVIDYPTHEIITDNWLRLRLIEGPEPVLRTEEVARSLARGVGEVRMGDLFSQPHTLTALGAAFLNACMWDGKASKERA
jgi:hypothetical protein